MMSKILYNIRMISTASQIGIFIILLFVLLLIYRYYINTYESKVPVTRVETRVRCPPGDILNKRRKDEIQPKKELHKNDLKNDYKINMYDDMADVDTYGFTNKLGNNREEHNRIGSELDQVYKQSVATPVITDTVSCNKKQDKSDLPIVNVPYYLLENGASLRLSEKPLL